MRAELATVGVREHVRSVVRYAKLLRLLATYELGRASTAITISGPLSILRHTTKYGRAFASFLPCVPATPGWNIEARCVLSGRRLQFVATSADPLGSPFALPRDADSAVERALVRDLRRLGTEWTIERETAAIPLEGGAVFFPDFTMRRRADVILVELVGFYTREYLEAKLRALAAIRSRPIVVVIDDALACDDAAIPAAEVVPLSQAGRRPRARRRGGTRSASRRACRRREWTSRRNVTTKTTCGRCERPSGRES